MDENLRRLEGVVDELARSVRALEARVKSLEGRQIALPEQDRSDHVARTPAAEGADAPVGGLAGAAEAAPEVVPAPARGPSVTAVLTAIGRTFLILAGAFLLRDLTDRGTLPQAWGVAAGIAYALVWIFFADRGGVRGSWLSAGFYGLSAVLIAYPLVLETTTTLHVLSPPLAGAIVAALTLVALAVAWRRRLRFVAWAFTLAALFTLLSLHLATDRRVLFTALLILLGVGTVWLAYGRRWWGPQWIVAPVVNAAVLQLSFMAAGAGGAGTPVDLSTSVVQIIAVGLLVGYLGSFAVRTIVRQRNVTFFEVIQSAGALLVGFGGAVHVARSVGSGGLGLGAAALMGGAVCYAVAFSFVRRRLGRGRNFFFYSSLALVLTFVGSPLVFHGGALTALLGIVAVAAAILGGKFDRVTVRFHTAAYSLAAALVSGLLAFSVSAFATGAGRTWSMPGWSAVLALILVLACYVTLAVTQRGRPPRARRIPRFVVSVVLVIGAGGYLVTLLVRTVAGIEAPDAATVALIRSGVLAVSAIALAALSRRAPLAELAWLVYPILIAGAAKLLIEDLRIGRPATLFMGFLLYGAALIVAPRLRRRPRIEGAAGAPATSSPPGAAPSDGS